MTKERFLNYTDAIVAIIATIMVLELPIPKTADLAGLQQALTPFLAYLLSFATIWAVWFNHHSLFREVKIINARVYWYDGAWVFTMSLFPFATAWVGRFPNQVLPEFLYLLVVFLWSIFFRAMELEISKQNKHIKNRTRFGTRIRRMTYFIMLSGFVIVWFFPMYVLFTVVLFIVIAISQAKHGRDYW
jgi:uncharacterized membrane protein